MRRKLSLGLLLVFVLLYPVRGVGQCAEVTTKELSSAGDTEYTWLIEPKYQSAGLVAEGLWPVYNGTGWGYVDSTDHVVLDFKYRRARSFHNGLAYAALLGPDQTSRDWGVIDRTGNYVLEARSGLELPLFHHASVDIDLVAFRDGATGKYGFLNLSGDVQIPARYDGFRHFSEGLAAVRSGDLFGVIDTQGTWVIPPRYNNLYSYFWKGYIPFRTEAGLWGIINAKGEVVVEAKYTDIEPSQDKSGPWVIGLGRLGEIKGVLDENLTVVVEPKYQGMAGIQLGEGYYRGGVAFLLDSKTYKALDTDGKELFSFSSFIAKPYSGVEGYYVLEFFGNRKFLLVNKQGALRLPPEFSALFPSPEGIVAAKKDGLWGLLLLKKQ